MGRSQEELVAMLRSTRQGESVSVVVARQEDLFLPRELVRPSFFCIGSLPPATACYFLSARLACVNTGSGRRQGETCQRVSSDRSPAGPC